MTIHAEAARARTVAGIKTKEAREALEKIAAAKAVNDKVEKQVGFTRERLDAAVIKATTEGLYQCAVWFPEPADLMRKVRTAIQQEYKDLGYEMDGGPVEDSRFNKYEISLKWAES